MKTFFKILFACCFAALFALPVHARGQRDEAAPLRIGILPDADSLPLMVARDRGFFQAEGAQVELVMFSNPNERDAALQAGRIDGAISDLLAAAFFVAAGFDVRITSLTNGRYGIVAAPDSGVASLADLHGRRIALSPNTIIQYTVDAQLAGAGVPMSEYEAVAVPNILLRLEMVLNGLVDAAGLPEPLLTAAVAQGARLLSTTETTGIDAGVLLFSRAALDSRLADVQAFYRAYYRAAREINANPDAFRDFLVAQAGFPAAVRDTFQFVTYTSPALPEEAQVTRTLAWLRDRGLLTASLSFADLTDPRAIAGN
ncbi:MAG: MetQ/NlpA family ABC transporter substrate-binding protein [Treponema sp.]|nr:MetQ/NlpA family ABC transporter substrate-binding protein [Treponema sp.]